MNVTKAKRITITIYEYQDVYTANAHSEACKTTVATSEKTLTEAVIKAVEGLLEHTNNLQED